MAVIEECEECRFWCPSGEGGKSGECRETGPQVFVTLGSQDELESDEEEEEGYEVESETVMAYWPPTEAHEWCGRFRPHGFWGFGVFFWIWSMIKKRNGTVKARRIPEKI
jgi:hypothetical protein